MIVPFKSTNFIKRMDRELSRYEVQSSVVDIILNKYFQETDCTNYLDSFITEYMENGGDISLKIIRQIIRSNDFNLWAQDHLCFHFKELTRKFVIKDNRLIIYRSITTKYDWIKFASKCNKINLGLFWSFRYDGAYPYYGNENHTKYIFKASVSLRDVDWFTTILLNLSELSYDEQEIRLFKNRKLKDFSVETVGEFFITNFSSKKKIFS